MLSASSPTQRDRHSLQAGRQDFSIPALAIELIKQFTACHLVSTLARQHKHSAITSMDDSDTVYVAGWNSLRRSDELRFEAGDRITQQQADCLLLKQLKQTVLPRLSALSGWNNLNENQQSALISYAHSLGENLFALSPQLSLATALRQGQYDLIPQIVQQQGVAFLDQNIEQRRQAEASLFSAKIHQDSFLAINRSRQLELSKPLLSGRDVCVLQKALIRSSYEIDADGIFGPITQWAVEKFQAKVGLPATGIANAKTQKILYARALYLQDPYLIGSDVKEAQMLLKRVGYDLEATGIFGMRTRKAAIAFQNHLGLIEDGIIAGQTLVRLLYLPELAEVA